MSRNKVVGLVVCGEQGFQTLAEGRIAEACTIQKGGAFRAGQ